MNNSSLRYWKKNKELKTNVEALYIMQNYKSNLESMKTEDSQHALEAGFEVLGPIVYSFSKWIEVQLGQNNYKKLFFLSREGKFIFQTFNRITGGVYDTEYLHVSRKALIVPLLAYAESFSEIMNLIGVFMKTPSIRTVLDICRIDISLAMEGLSNNRITLEDNVYELEDGAKEFLYHLIMELGKEYFCAQNDNLLKYLEKKGFFGNVAICDIGWQGTMQKALEVFARENSIPVRIEGLYLGVRVIGSDKYPDLAKKGFLFDVDKRRYLDNMFRVTTEIIEMMFMCDEGSTVAYKKNSNGDISPVKTEVEYNNANLQFISIFQEGAMRFVSCAMREKIISNLFLTPELAVQGYISYAVFPSNKTVSLYKKFLFSDERVKPIVSPYGVSYYLMHPNRLKRDLSDTCTLFTLKNIFKISLPYYKIISYFMFHLNIKSEYRQNNIL